MHHTTPRVLVIGLDGATFDVLTPLVESGVMPCLGQLMQESAMAELFSTMPYITPVAWTTFLTGCDPQSHGIFDYRFFDHRQTQLRLNHSGRIRCRTLFDAVAESGDVVSLNVPMTYPAPNGVPGIIVGGIDSPSIQAALAPYPQFGQAVRNSGARFDVDTIWKSAPQTFDALTAKVRQTEADFRGRATAAEIADGMLDWRLMVVQFQTLDALQHRCWHLFGIEDGTLAPSTWVDRTHDALRALDQAIGRLLELAERRGAAVVVVSDHGFGAFREKISIPEVLARRGLLAPASLGSRVGRRLTLMRWKARRWLKKQSQSRGSTASLARPVESLLPIDWKRSIAAPLHGNLAGLVYLNTPRRFGRGPVTTPRLEEQALRDVVAAFTEARHPTSGEILFEEVYALQERFGCDPVERMWPDVVAIPAPGFHTRFKMDGAQQLLAADANLTGTHRVQGVLMVKSSGTQLGARRSAELRDVAPTILHLLDQRPLDQMSGRVLHELFRDPQFRSLPRRPRPAARPSHAEIELSDQQVVETRLRELGYLE